MYLNALSHTHIRTGRDLVQESVGCWDVPLYYDEAPNHLGYGHMNPAKLLLGSSVNSIFFPVFLSPADQNQEKESTERWSSATCGFGEQQWCHGGACHCGRYSWLFENW